MKDASSKFRIYIATTYTADIFWTGLPVEAFLDRHSAVEWKLGNRPDSSLPPEPPIHGGITPLPKSCIFEAPTLEAHTASLPSNQTNCSSSHHSGKKDSEFPLRLVSSLFGILKISKVLRRLGEETWHIPVDWG